jgi:hypothetical protein
MKAVRTIVFGVAATAVAGCASAPRSFPVVGEAELLAGVWQGEFTSGKAGRSGTIHFELKAGQDSAYGDVIMIPETWDRGNRPPTEYPAPPVETPELVGIRFVRVADGQVRGTLTPYYDAACECTVSTIFDGALKRDRIEGSYRTLYSPGGTESVGKWKVKRVSAELDPCIDGDDSVIEGEDRIEVELR